MSAVFAVGQENLRPGQVSVRSHTATLEMEQNENRRINESGSYSEQAVTQLSENAQARW